MSESENRPEETTTVQPKPYDYKDLSQEAPLTIDPKENDYTEEADKLDPVYTLKFTEPDLMLICNALAGQIAGSWQFSPKDTIDDDIRSAYQTLQFLKLLNAKLPEDKRMGCIVESLLPFPEAMSTWMPLTACKLRKWALLSQLPVLISQPAMYASVFLIRLNIRTQDQFETVLATKFLCLPLQELKKFPALRKKKRKRLPWEFATLGKTSIKNFHSLFISLFTQFISGKPLKRMCL